MKRPKPTRSDLRLARDAGAPLPPDSPEKARIYEQLERVRHIISNVELTPLPDADDQASVLYHLTQARTVYRRAYDGGK
jgi:hypothetical protein